MFQGDLRMTRLSRRNVLFSLLALAASSRTALAQTQALRNEADPFGSPDGFPVDEQYYDPALLPPPESPIDYPIETVPPRRIRKKFRRQMVGFEGPEQPGTIVIDPDNRFLYHVLAYMQCGALRRGRGPRRLCLGGRREGRHEAALAALGSPARDGGPRRRARQWVNGQPGGPENPLGARALYLYANGEDTLYRIHGTNEPQSIGKAMSSGCIRMLNQDIAELFDNVIVGTPVIVRASRGS